MEIKYIEMESIIGINLKQIKGVIAEYKPEKALLVVPKINLVARILDLQKACFNPVAIDKGNREEIMEKAAPGFYLISYEMLPILEGLRPFFDMIIFDETHRPRRLTEQPCMRLIRPVTKVVVNFNKVSPFPRLLGVTDDGVDFSPRIAAFLDNANRISSLEACLEAFINDDECCLDHHGVCQTHSVDQIDGECGMVVARRLLGKV